MLNIVLDYGARLIRLPVEARTVPDRLRHAARDLCPKDRGENVKANGPHSHLNVRVKRNHVVTTGLLASNANVPDIATDATARHEHTQTLAPDLVELFEEPRVVIDCPHLVGVAIVFFESPVRRRGDDEMQDRKSTRLNSSHGYISYAVFCLKKKIRNYN